MNNRASDPRIDQLVDDVDTLRAQMAVNTAITSEVRDLLLGFRLVAKFAKWIAATIASVSAAVVTAVEIYRLFKK